MRADNDVHGCGPALTYAKVLADMAISRETIAQTRAILSEVPQTAEVLGNPTVTMEQKSRIIQRVFPEEIRNFLKTLCAYRRTRLLDSIFAVWDRLQDERSGTVKGVLICTTPPGEQRRKGIEDFLCRKYKAKRARLEVRTEEALLGGFILRVGSDEYDRSVKGSMDRLAQKIAGGSKRWL